MHEIHASVCNVERVTLTIIESKFKNDSSSHAPVKHNYWNQRFSLAFTVKILQWTKIKANIKQQQLNNMINKTLWIIWPRYLKSTLFNTDLVSEEQTFCFTDGYMIYYNSTRW